MARNPLNSNAGSTTLQFRPNRMDTDRKPHGQVDVVSRRLCQHCLLRAPFEKAPTTKGAYFRHCRGPIQLWLCRSPSRHVYLQDVEPTCSCAQSPDIRTQSCQDAALPSESAHTPRRSLHVFTLQYSSDADAQPSSKAVLDSQECHPASVFNASTRKFSSLLDSA